MELRLIDEEHIAAKEYRRIFSSRVFLAAMHSTGYVHMIVPLKINHVHTIGAIKNRQECFAGTR
jgi:hypothetical protein